MLPGTPRAFCRYCGNPVGFDEGVICHEWPWSLFGPNAKWNLFVGHAECNRAAGDSPASLLEMISLRAWLYLFAFLFFLFLCLLAWMIVQL